MNWAELRVSIPVVVVAAILLLRLSENSKIKGDAAIGMISTGALAVGVIAISVTTGMNTDVCNYMFGSILSLSKADVRLSIGLSAVVLVLFILFYSKIFAVTFDETFSRAVGTRAGVYNMLLAVLTAVTIVLGMRMMGAMLISALIIFPALTSMRVCKRFKTVILCAAAVSLICFFTGVVLSYWYSLPTGPAWWPSILWPSCALARRAFFGEGSKRHEEMVCIFNGCGSASGGLLGAVRQCACQPPYSSAP
jgi:zinc transport system permease protein